MKIGYGIVYSREIKKEKKEECFILSNADQPSGATIEITPHRNIKSGYLYAIILRLSRGIPLYCFLLISVSSERIFTLNPASLILFK